MTFHNKIEEMEAIRELKHRLSHEISSEMSEDENLFCRFLRARDFNLDQAEVMLKKHLEWRKKLDVNNIMKYKQPEVLEKYIHFVFLGFDNEGFPVRYVSVGYIDWIGITLSVKSEDFTKRAVYELENELQRMKIQSKKLGKTVGKCVYILNMENFSFAQATNKIVILNLASNLNIYINNYPDLLKMCYVINATFYFTFVYAVLKRILPCTLLNKIKVYSDDRWKEDLLEVMNIDILPTCLGGTRTDLDNNLVMNEKTTIPEKYYIRKNKGSLASCPGVQKVTLPRADFYEVMLEVKEPGSYLEWEFETKCRDVGFGLFFQQTVDEDESNIELIPIQRIDTEEFAETGLYLCEEEGTYVIVFDNTYSWVRAKEIFYRVKIVEPIKQES